MEKKIKANEDNDLKFRDGLDLKKKKDPKEINESCDNQKPSKLEYFTE